VSGVLSHTHGSRDREVNLPDPLLSRADLVELFNRELAPALPVADVEATAIRTMKYALGSECVVLLDLRGGGSAVATFGSESVLAEAFARHYADGPSTPGKATFVAEHGCLVELFPADWRLPSLAAALSPAQGAVDVLRYRPHVSCVLRFRLPATDAVGKLYADGERAARTFASLEALHGQAADGLVPAPVAFVESLRLVVMERVAGTSLKAVLKRAASRDDVERALVVAAETLCALHARQLQSEQPRLPQHQAEELRARATAVSLVAPALAGRIERVLDRSCALVDSMPHVDDLRCVHGDFKPSQLLLDGERATIVDLDRAAMGDPALDLGAFTAQLHKEALHRDQLDLRPLAPRFLAAYEACAGATGLGPRVAVCQSLALVRMALRRVERDPAPVARGDEPSLPALLLDAAEESLPSR
jgi:aminoglycoside phosphotransferase (APT) family kinase protein